MLLHVNAVIVVKGVSAHPDHLELRSGNLEHKGLFSPSSIS